MSDLARDAKEELTAKVRKLLAWAATNQHGRWHDRVSLEDALQVFSEWLHAEAALQRGHELAAENGRLRDAVSRLDPKSAYPDPEACGDDVPEQDDHCGDA